MSYADAVIEARRRAVLDVLAEAPDGEASAGIVRSALLHVGLAIGEFGRDVQWLESSALLVSWVNDGVQYLRLTGHGFDVASGRAVADGVARKIG